jgi:hypothetical protein
VTESEVVGRTATIRKAIYSRESFQQKPKVKYFYNNTFEKSETDSWKVLRK